MSELKPCPFCGATPSVGFQQGPGETKHYFVNCPECLASTNCLIHNSYDETEAAEAWNRRAPAPDALVEALNMLLAVCDDTLSELEGHGWYCEDRFRKAIAEARSAALAAPRPERTYSAEEAVEIFVAGAKFVPLSGRPELWIDQVKAEALRRYGERKDGEAGG